MFLVGFFGCLGALRENVTMLKIFMWSLIVLFVMQISAAALAFVFKDDLEDKARENIDDAIANYRKDDDLRNLIDFIQREFECCGADNQQDWGRLNRHFNCTDGRAIPNLPESCGVPFSCCKTADQRINSQCGYGVNNFESPFVAPSQIIWTRGCVDALINCFEDNMLAFAVTILMVALVQSLGITCSWILINQIHRQALFVIDMEEIDME